MSEEISNKLNKSDFTRAHVKSILVAGSGFLTDSYDNFIIGLIVPMLAYSYFNKSSLDTFSDGWLKASSSYGNMVGQFSFAILVDIFGRKRIYGIELIILIIGALGSALLSWPICL
jgi:PHS family inorganic phosphate transporter-like MFS transporter